MKEFEIVLTKSYIVNIKAENEFTARELSEFFTSDITDISTEKDRLNFNFKIENIECKLNETYEVIEENEYN